MILVLSLAVSTVAMAQNNTVKGTVTSSEDGLPIPGVSVIYDGTIVGTMTDSKGQFSLPSVTGTTHVVFSCIGFVTKVVPIGQVSAVQMDPDLESLEEEEQKKALDQMNEEELQEIMMEEEFYNDSEEGNSAPY